VKLCIFGAGAIGGHIAARATKGGADVSLLARGASLDVIRAKGLRVHTAEGEIHLPLPASDNPKELGPQDAVLVTVKAPALPAVAATISPLLGPDTGVAFIINGIPWWYFIGHGGPLDDRRLPSLDPDDALYRAVGPGRVIGGVVWSACTVISPGVVEVGTRSNRLSLGEPDGRHSARVRALADLLTAGGLPTDANPRIREAIWQKLVLNLCSTPMGVLAEAGPNVIYRDPVCADAVRKIAAEVGAMAAALGYPIDPDAEGQLAAGKRIVHVPSMVQDLVLGRKMEIAAMFEAPLELGRLAGVATPTLDLLVALARIRAQGARLYP
jgi:2-dehydropantoate 2-reductase